VAPVISVPLLGCRI